IFAHLARHPEAADMKLVLAGKPFTPELARLVDELSLRERVVQAVDVSFEAKVALYTKARALLFPSFYEGFGLPIVEAQMCGCPVITSNLPPMDEVAGGSALLIDPRNEEEAASSIRAALGTLPDLVSKGYENVKRFDLDRMGADYVRTYRQLLEGARA
ncbi:MAG TPA: glycosyltransferase, partial [Fimbriimonas sp.]